MNPLNYLKGVLRTRGARMDKAAILEDKSLDSIDLQDFASGLNDRSGYYRRAYRSFHNELPQALRDHREYFQSERRGFGEDAFHTLWWLLVKRFQPANFLEIGVYRGQTISLVALLNKLADTPCDIHGISPFSSAGDSVSKYRAEVDYLSDTLANFDHFSLPHPNLLKAYSTDSEAVAHIRSRTWDCIYIDGNHDYEIVRKDWEVCSTNVNPGGLIVLDDSGLTTSYRPPRFATGGHPGPSKLAAELTNSAFAEILQVGHNRVFQKGRA